MLMELAAGLLFSITLVSASYALNRRLIGAKLHIEPYRLALTASAVLLFAILGEAIVNPLYEYWFSSKLWEYRVLPLHDGNVSALAAFIWTAYGIHLYFTLQTLEQRLPSRLKNSYAKAFLIGFEAPLIAEVTGNLVFLSMANTYYAYYLPSDIGHLTSLRVIPIYMICIFVGLHLLRSLEQLPKKKAMPPVLFAGGIAFLLAGL